MAMAVILNFRSIKKILSEMSFVKENKQLQDSSGGHIGFMHVQNLKINK